MKLPNYEKALVAEAKITQYLLNDAHPKPVVEENPRMS
jgi:hypothetical protein